MDLPTLVHDLEQAGASLAERAAVATGGAAGAARAFVVANPLVVSTALLAAALVLAIVVPSTRRRRSAAAPRRAPALARTLAAEGVPQAEIARRTGLARDAVALLTATPAAHDARKGRPGTASFAAVPSSRRVARRAMVHA